MKFIKSLLCNCLCINNLFNINRQYVTTIKKTIPKNYCSFKKTKQQYLNNNIYYDVYRESLLNYDKDENIFN